MKTIKSSFHLPVFFIFLLAIIVFSGYQTPPALNGALTPQRPSLDLHFLANEGVMLSTGGQKILIDALFDKPHPNYRAPSPEIIEKVIKGKIPFDQINLILFTHKHGDHFDAGVVTKVMENRPKSLLVVPADAIPDLQGAAKNWAKLKSRVLALDLKIGQAAEKTYGGIRFKAFRTRHSGDRESPHNLVYYIQMGKWRILHEGDSDGRFETFKKFGLKKNSIDLALVHYWFPLEPGGAKILQELLVPDHIALIHLPKRLEGDAPSKIAQVKKYYKDIVLLLPNSKLRTYH